MLLLKKLCDEYFITKEQISCTFVVRDQCLHCERKVKNTMEICTLPLFKMNRQVKDWVFFSLIWLVLYKLNNYKEVYYIIYLLDKLLINWSCIKIEHNYMGWKNKTTSLKILAYLLMYFSHSSTVEKKIAAYFEEVKIGGSFCSNCSGNTKKRKIFLAEASCHRV